MTLAQPLRFKPFALEKIWGGRRLESFLPDGLQQTGVVGEIWTLADRQGMSSVVAEGGFEGRKLAGLMLSEREALLGSVAPTAEEHFPLLVKFLDATQPLSVQVHPDAQAAKRLGGEAKDECWYILSAEPGSQIYIGLAPGVDAATFAAEAHGPRVVDLLQAHDVHAGQFVSIPAGTVHALGAGVTLVEVQENADTTYRIFDWGRTGLDGQPREIHCEQALKAIDYDLVHDAPTTPHLAASEGVNGRVPLLTRPGFEVDLLGIHQPESLDSGGRPWVYVVLNGGGTLVLEDGDGSWKVRRGETWLLPADLGRHQFTSVDGDLELLRVSLNEEVA